MEKPTAAIRRRALDLGFVLCGFTSAAPPEQYPRFREWIAANRHAGMDYLADERSLTLRADPTRLLPAARSIIALAIPHPPPPPAGNFPLEGDVAAYALGDDYHELIRTRLRTLCEYIDRLAGRRMQSRGYVDTAPLLEREIASRAGLGWIGRNSMLIHPEFGSFLLLAEILTELDLPTDPPFPADRCGECARCRQACPTGCILPDRTIDSGRCISYLTIEHRGPIPENLRGATGRHFRVRHLPDRLPVEPESAARRGCGVFSAGPFPHPRHGTGIPASGRGMEGTLPAQPNPPDGAGRVPAEPPDGTREHPPGGGRSGPGGRRAGSKPGFKGLRRMGFGADSREKWLKNRMFFGLWRIPSRFGRITSSGPPNHPSFQKVNSRPSWRMRREGENV
jgi:ferredoxin